MTEHTLLKGFLERLRRETIGVVLRHSDDVTSGIPDFSFTFLGYTYWVEAKTSMRGKVKTTELQRLTMERLGSKGRAVWLIWELKNDKLVGVCFVRPELVKADGTYIPFWWTDQFESITEAHERAVKRMLELQ